MMKLFIFSAFLLLFVVFAFPLFYFNYSQVVTTTDKKVNYELPYPGILPDNPLYFIKAARDRALEFTSRDPMKKAEFYLLFSDKRAYMGLQLVKKGKQKLAISTLSKGEKYFLKIPPLLSDSRKQGIRYSDEFLFNLKLSNAKHKEVVESLMKEMLAGEREALGQVLELNKKAKEQLDLL